MVHHEVLVVGGGLAGLRAAIQTHDSGVDVAVLSQVHPVRSHSGAAQGGINAALGNAEKGRDDTWEKHAFDTIKGSDYLADQDAVEIMTGEAPQCIFELEHWGVPFSRTKEGKIAQRPFGGAGFPRTCYAADKTGHYLLHTLYQQALKRRLKVYSEWLVISLVVGDSVCRGVIALNLLSGELAAFGGKAVIFATGGAGRIYGRSTNAIISSGLGAALAYQAGVALKDMELIQFHPTSLYGSNILITEAARGEGGYLLNKLGERFMKNYAAEAMELAPRDIVARAIQTEIDQGRGVDNAYVYLDLRHLGKKLIDERLPGIRDIALDFARVNPIEKPIPIQPGQHYTMGGIDCNYNGETEIGGFYACGECACVSVHGANRLGGNSLLDCVVFGKRSALSAAQYVQAKAMASNSEKALQDALEKARRRLEKLLQGSGDEDPTAIRDELRALMIEKAGIFRDKDNLSQAVAKISELQGRWQRLRPCQNSKRFNLDLMRSLELGEQLEVAEVIARGALLREESRGSHYRLDFKERDDQRWLKHTLARWTPTGPSFSFKDVVITRWPPQVRKY